jgi:hypothetical protein
MSHSREHLIMVLRAERSSKKQRHVEERIQSGKCLGTTRDGSECESTATRRGLCSKCHQAMQRRMNGLDAEKKAAYEARLISAGVLLADREVLRIKDRSVFKRLA